MMFSASGAGNGDSPSSCSMRRRTSPGRVPSSRWPWTTSSSSCRRVMPVRPRPDAAWNVVTTSPASCHAPCSTARASIIVITVAPGLAMMPRGRSAILRGLTSGTTSGTSVWVRKTVLLSMATTPRPAASSTHSRAIPGGMSKMATSTPSKNSGVSASTTTSAPATVNTAPTSSAPAASRMLPQCVSRVGRTSSTTRPTAPVTPTTARVGRPPTVRSCPWSVTSAAGSPVDDGLSLERVQPEGSVDGADRIVQQVVAGDDRDADLRGGDHLDVDTGLRQGLEERGRDPRVGPHPGTDERELADLVVVLDRREAHVTLDALERRHGGGAVGLGQGEGDVGEAGLRRRHVLDDHVEVDLGQAHRLEDLGGHAGPVRNADDGDLGLAAVVRHSGDDRLFHEVSLRSGLVGDDRALLLGERRPDVDGDAEAAGVLDAAQVEHLRAARRELQHLLVADPVDLASARHDAGVGGEDPVHVGVDLADLREQHRGEGQGGGVRAPPPESRDLLCVLADAPEN